LGDLPWSRATGLRTARGAYSDPATENNYCFCLFPVQLMLVCPCEASYRIAMSRRLYLITREEAASYCTVHVDVWDSHPSARGS
jgi:hypothetical protein